MSSIISGHEGNDDRMSGTSSGGSGIVGVGGALSFMGCVRDASPPPYHHHHHHHHHHTHVMDDSNVQPSHNTLVKEPKKRRFHPLRGLRRIFRRKSRSTADTRINCRMNERDSETIRNNSEELTVRHPAGRTDEIRSKSANELLTDSCERQSVFLRRSGVDDALSKLRGTSGQLSVSHDSIFPGEVPHTRPLSSLDTLIALERRQGSASDDSMDNDYNSRGLYNHRISLGVLEQIKTAIEKRHHSSSTESNYVMHSSRECYQKETTENYFTRGDKRNRINEAIKEEKKDNKEERLRIIQTIHEDSVDRTEILPAEDLPEFESPSLNHTAAHHRISVRPKNRRPPRRTATTTDTHHITNSTSSSTITTISETIDILDSLECQNVNNTQISNSNSPLETNGVSLNRKLSSQHLRSCDDFDEVETKIAKIPTSIASLSPDSLDLTVTKIIMDGCEADNNDEINRDTHELSERISKNMGDELDIVEMKLPKKSLSILNKHTKSSDNLVNSFSKSSEDFNKSIECKHVIPTDETLESFTLNSTDGFNKIPEEFEVKPTSRRLATMSTEIIDNIDKLRITSTRGRHHHLNQATKIIHSVSKSFDNLEAVDTVLISDDSIEQRRSSFEIWPKKNIKLMSMSSENVDALVKSQELDKRNSVTDFHLPNVMHPPKIINKIISKSTENFNTTVTNFNEKKYIKTSSMDKHYWRISGRATSSESSDNLEIENHVENQTVRKPSKKIYNPNMMDISCENSNCDNNKRPVLMKISSRFQKSSESSEVDSTDTLDSDKQNKYFDSTETIDSLEKDMECDGKIEQHHKSYSRLIISESESDDRNISNTNNGNNGDSMDNTSLVSTDKPYWRQTCDSKENIDIHQLLAITLVGRMTDNSNIQRDSIAFPKKNLTTLPTSPTVKQDGNKLLFNNLLSNKNDEELQNMLNGNISEVSTDTKSFKEKLIMFEKLGK